MDTSQTTNQEIFLKAIEFISTSKKCRFLCINFEYNGIHTFLVYWNFL